MSKVIIKNELKLELYRDFIKSGVVPNGPAPSRFASHLKYYVENVYAHLIAEGIIIDADDVEYYPDGKTVKLITEASKVTHYHVNGDVDYVTLNGNTTYYRTESDCQELNNAEVELEKSKERFLRGHAERMDELNLALNNIKEDLENCDTIEEVFDDVQKAKEIEEELEGISKDLDALLD